MKCRWCDKEAVVITDIRDPFGDDGIRSLCEYHAKFYNDTCRLDKPEGKELLAGTIRRRLAPS